MRVRLIPKNTNTNWMNIKIYERGINKLLAQHKRDEEVLLARLRDFVDNRFEVRVSDD